jgi:hypothetical protein
VTAKPLHPPCFQQAVDPAKMVEARAKGASPGDLHRAFTGEFQPQAPLDLRIPRIRPADGPQAAFIFRSIVTFSDSILPDTVRLNRGGTRPSAARFLARIWGAFSGECPWRTRVLISRASS